MWPGLSDSSQTPTEAGSSTPHRPPASPPHQRSNSKLGSGDQALRDFSGPRTIPWKSNMQSLSSPIFNPVDSPCGPLSPSATDRVFPIRSVVSVDPTATPTQKMGTTGDDGFPGMSLPTSAASDRNTGSRQFSTGSAPSVESTPEMMPVDLPLRRRRESEALKSNAQGLKERVAGERMGGSRQLQSFAGIADTRSQTTAGHGGDDNQSTSESTMVNMADGSEELVTARFKHIVTEGGHAVIVGRDGDTLQRCEDEPIHIPGAIQGFGLLIALQEDEEGKLVVRVVSENSTRIIGYSPKQLFALESFCDILSEEQTDNLLDHLDFIKDEDADPATNGPEVFTLAIRSPSRKMQKLWCAMHTNENNRDLIICEFELEDDPLNPLVPAGEGTPEPPEDTLSSDPTPEEYVESTVNVSRPLRVLRGARKRKGEAAAMEVFNIMSQVQEQLANASSLDAFLKVLVGVVKELTGFHRVMIYQFDQAWNGRVVTELVDPRATKDLYKGLNFPASDIPKQARDLYKINKVRLLYDRDQETARLVCRTAQDLEKPLDLTFAYLRAMSPIHIKYLANMAVRASMSISINAFHELWGLIACHSYGAKGMRVSFPIRKMCRVVGDAASRNIERLSYASRLQARKLINTVPTESNPSGYIIASSDDLLKLFDADYGLLSIRDETKILGMLEQTQEALAMLEYLRLRKITCVTSSTDIRVDFPDLRYSPGISVIAGLLLVPLSVSGSDFIVFFRRGQTREVKWAGNPYEKFVKQGTEGYLEPRKSFRTWSETVVGKCRDWTEEQIETAAVLCLVYGKFIEVWRQKEAALQNSKLTRLLLANSAHEVRTPLNAIINYLEIALEGAIDQETRENLSRSHSASKSLIYVINDLLDLTKTEEGHNLIKDEVFELPATVREAAYSFVGDAKRKNIEYEVIENPGVPQLVVGDQRRVRQAISNVMANAIKYTSKGSVKVEMWLRNQVDNRAEIDIVILDTGIGMSPEKLDALFRDLEQVQSESDEGLQEKLAPETKAIKGEENSQRTLGLGLALVARIVRNMNGQLRLKSEEGKGSRFVIQFGFDLPDDKPKVAAMEEAKAAGVGLPVNQPTTPPVEKGEVMLVNKSAQKASAPKTPKEIVHRKSTESVHTLGSIRSNKSASSARSDVDRLIEAIQEPNMAKATSGDAGDDRPGSSNRANRRPGSRSRRPVGGVARANSMSMVLPLTSDQALEQRQGPGLAKVKDSKTPVKPIRMPGETSFGSPGTKYPSSQYSARTPSRVIFDTPDRVAKHQPLDAEKLRILVAEDDPINSKIIQKRLEKIGHEVRLTINGEECSSTYGERPAFFDVVLMDMQMPIVDGLTSTKMIRSFEKSHPSEILSQRAALNGRVPIFAVSASLIERECQKYIDAGFDGWILKPVDFKRLSLLLSGIVEEDTRETCLYKSGEWERGGWFRKRQPDIFSASTRPSVHAPVGISRAPEPFPAQPKDDPTDQERERLNNLDNDAVHAQSTPQDSGQSGNVEQANEASQR